MLLFKEKEVSYEISENLLFDFRSSCFYNFSFYYVEPNIPEKYMENFCYYCDYKLTFDTTLFNFGKYQKIQYDFNMY